MNFTLKTSKYTKETLLQLQASTGITPNILIRYAVALSLKKGTVDLLDKEFSDGLVLNRNTVTGEYDYIFRAMITQAANKEVTDEEYFP
ncbi:DndE family protein, partial [Mycobacterium tuberculosis]|uniref:DndE family protein n=1 Tax=Mycobacterium tuberculosis TaxID=1773 RepID=UPI0011150928